MSCQLRYAGILILLIAIFGSSPSSVRAQLEVANGNYDGNWNNTTFTTMGAVSMNINNNDGTMTANATLDLDGIVFGFADPSPVVLTGPYPVPITDPFSVSNSVNHPQLGAVTLTVNPVTGAVTGQFLVDDVLGPTTGVGRMNVVGTINLATFDVNFLYAIYFFMQPPGVLDCDQTVSDPFMENAHACGTFTMTRTSLPVELTAFEGLLEGDNVLLSWATETETNNAGFAIEHAPPFGDFVDIGFVEGAGTTLDPQQYNYQVHDLESGTHLFRLKQLDLDGTYSYSQTLEFKLELPEEIPLALHAPFPMPAQDYTIVRFLNHENQPVRLELFDVTGRMIREVYRGYGSGLETEAVISTHDLPGGFYLLRLQNQQGRITTRPLIINH